MTDQLRTMLRDAADDHPDFAITGDPWRRGRRIRLGRRLAGGAGAAVAVAAVIAGTVLLTTPDLTSTPEPAQEQPIGPALPDQLFEVPLNIPDISDDPLGESAAVAYTATVRIGTFGTDFSREGPRPVVVGAHTGAVRAIRDVGLAQVVALSPDGTMLAAGNLWALWSGPQADLDPPVVHVVDLATGQVETFTLPDHRLGGGIERLTWSPDSSALAVTAITTVSVSEDGNGGEGSEVHGHVDVRTGEWREDGIGVTYAFSSDGQRMVVDASIRDSNGTNPVAVDLDGFHGVAFSPDDRLVAAVSGPVGSFTPPDPYELEIFDAVTGERTTQLDLGEYSYARLIGWGDRGVLIESSRVVPSEIAGEDDSLVTLVERIDISDSASPMRSTVMVDHSHSGPVGIAAAFVDADTRQAEPPEARFDWLRWVPEPFLLALLGIVVLPLVVRALMRRLRRGGVNAPE